MADVLRQLFCAHRIGAYPIWAVSLTEHALLKVFVMLLIEKASVSSCESGCGHTGGDGAGLLWSMILDMITDILLHRLNRWNLFCQFLSLHWEWFITDQTNTHIKVQHIPLNIVILLNVFTGTDRSPKQWLVHTGVCTYSEILMGCPETAFGFLAE